MSTDDTELAQDLAPDLAPDLAQRGQDLRLLEALFFAAAAPLDEAAIGARLGVGRDIPGLVAELAALYENRGVNLVRTGGGWTFRTAADLAPRLALERVVARKLSRAAIETLAIVAYHQPVTRGEIEEIRGVVISRGILDTLMEAGWVRPKGHRNTPGRPATWVTTPEFLLHFGLDNLTDLPGVEELKAAGLLDSRPAAALGEIVGEGDSAGAPAEEEGGGLGETVELADLDDAAEAREPEDAPGGASEGSGRA
jgi:segregation and condensation protein B